MPSANMAGEMQQKWQGWESLGPREAVMAGIVGAVIAWLALHYLAISSYMAALPYETSKNLNTAICFAAFAVPYWIVRWLLRNRAAKR
jgi:hypothetical protein